MDIMTQPVDALAPRHRHPLSAALLVFVFWIIGSLLVIAAHIELEPISPAACAVASIAALIANAWAYSRFSGRDAGVSHALGVGIAWLMLSISTEIALASSSGQPWFTLLGSPNQPLFRNLLLFIWIFAPVFFARREAQA